MPCAIPSSHSWVEPAAQRSLIHWEGRLPAHHCLGSGWITPLLGAMVVVLKVWLQDLTKEMWILWPHQKPTESELWRGCPGIYVITSLPGDSEAHWHLRFIGLDGHRNWLRITEDSCQSWEVMRTGVTWGTWLKTHILIGQITKGAGEFAFLANSQVTLMLLPAPSPTPHLTWKSRAIQFSTS